MTELPPPWIIFPDLRPSDPATQGAEEAYIDLEWLPFWRTLDKGARGEYFDRWNAAPEWREVVAERFDQEEFDVEEDAHDSAAWAAARESGGDLK